MKEAYINAFDIMTNQLQQISPPLEPANRP